jgi:hypothetical protein
MTRELVQKASAEYLRSAQPRLLCRIDPAGNLGVKLTPYISEVNIGWKEVIDEGYDPHHSPLGCPVYWRVVNRGDEQFYCSTFLATRAQVIKGWGTKGLTYCDPITEMAVARIETNLRCEWPRGDDRKLEQAAAFRRM